MDDCNVRRIQYVVQECKMEKRVQRIEQRQEQHGSNDIEIQVHHCGTLCVLGSANAREQRGYAGADVLTHDDGNRNAIGNAAGERQRLQNTDRSGRTLNDSGDDRASEHAEDRIAESGHDAHKLRHVRQRRNRGGHHVHAVHQNRKTAQDGADGLLLLFLGKHDQNHADDGKHRRKRRWLEQLNQQRASLNAG
ncbi:hypothetical protein SDC9_152697 [bioreactor metagenome]|uniref:Uncharacterized protein n=1 Tax=bioreactor metagenome TaxID=1076179 RepID=A0A645EUB7_9ZZZZ